jgi:hypothetical protein
MVGRGKIRRKLFIPNTPKIGDTWIAKQCLESFTDPPSYSSKSKILNMFYEGLGDRVSLPVAEAMLLQWAKDPAAVQQTIIRVLSNPATASLIQELELRECGHEFITVLRQLIYNAVNMRSISQHSCMFKFPFKHLEDFPKLQSLSLPAASWKKRFQKSTLRSLTVTGNSLYKQVEPVCSLLNLNRLKILLTTINFSRSTEVDKSVRVDFSTLPNLSDITLGSVNKFSFWPCTAWKGELQSSHALTVYGNSFNIYDRQFFTPFLSRLRSLHMHGVVQKATNSELLFHELETLELLHCDAHILEGALFPVLRHLSIILTDKPTPILRVFGLSDYRYWMSGLNTLILRGPNSTFLKFTDNERALITNALDLQYLYICNVGNLTNLDGFLATVQDKLQAAFVAEKDSDTVNQPHFGSWQDAIKMQQLSYLRYGCKDWDESLLCCRSYDEVVSRGNVQVLDAGQDELQQLLDDEQSIEESFS